MVVADYGVGFLFMMFCVRLNFGVCSSSVCCCFVCLLFSLWCVILIVLYCVVLCVYESSVGTCFRLLLLDLCCELEFVVFTCLFLYDWNSDAVGGVDFVVGIF